MRHFDPRRTVDYLTVEELRELCRMRGADSTGLRADLVARVQDLIVRETPRLRSKELKAGRAATADPLLPLHPEVQEAARSLFDSRHYPQAVFEALKRVNLRVQSYIRATRGVELDGYALITRSMSPDDPWIRLTSLEGLTGRDEQQGYMMIFAGTMLAIRNPKAHALVQLDERSAIHRLFLASILMKKLDDAGVPSLDRT